MWAWLFWCAYYSSDEITLKTNPDVGKPVPTINNINLGFRAVVCFLKIENNTYIVQGIITKVPTFTEMSKGWDFGKVKIDSSDNKMTSR